MRHITKFFCRSAVMLMLSGLVLSVAGWAMGADTNPVIRWNGREYHLGWNGSVSSGDWNGPWSDSGELHTAGSSNLAAFQSVVVNVNMADISFQWAEDYGVDLTWYQNRAMTYEVKDGVLTVKSAHAGPMINNMDNSGTGQVIILLPESAKLETVSLTTDMGDIDVNALDIKYLSVYTDMGDIFVTDCTAGETFIAENAMGDINVLNCTVPKSLTASTDMGDLFLSGAISGTLDVSNDMGDIQIFNDLPASRFGYDIEADMGEITVDGETFRSHAKKSRGSDTIKIRSDMGDVELYFSGD